MMGHNVLHEKYLLACDAHFGRPDPTNDHVWEVRLNDDALEPISFFTTFGLQAKSMHLNPIFPNQEGVLSPVGSVIQEIKVIFRTTNFIELAFSTFQSIDVILRVWVPTSQVLVGQVSIINNTPKTQTTEMDWKVQLDPILPGKPVTLDQMGINKVLCGQTGKLYPLFYLSGGPEQSTSSIPGLTTRTVLTAGASRQLTWVLAAGESPEASLQSARQYSSHQLDLEKIPMEMEQQKRFVRTMIHDEPLYTLLLDSQVQAHQLISPGISNLRNITYLQERTPLTPSVSDKRFPQFSPAWSGQTLPTLHLLAQVLLPGYPSTLQKIITNELDSQTQDGKIDLNINAGAQPTGLLAPPMFCTLVEKLIPYVSDPGWFIDSYPRLEKFIWKWTRSGEPLKFSHPLQTGFFEEGDLSGKTGEQFWLRLTTTNHPFFLSLLLKEINALRNIARKAGSTPSDWVVEEEGRITRENLDLWDADSRRATTQDLLSGKSHSGAVLSEFSSDGKYSCPTRFHSPTTLCICIDHEGQLPGDLQFSISGRLNGKSEKIELTKKDFQTLGNRSISTIFTPFSSVSNLQVKNSHGGVKGLFIVADLTVTDITSLMPIWAGIIDNEKIGRILDGSGILPFLDGDGLWLKPCPSSPDNLRLPDFLAIFIIEGLLANGMQPLAMDAFRKHFLSDYAVKKRSLYQGRIGNLVPVLLYLNLLGIRQISPHELILQCFNTPGSPVTVQYGQTNIMISSNKVILQVPGVEPLVITTSEPQRILIERERRSSE